MKQKRVFLSEGSSLSAREAITALGQAGYLVDLCDPNPLCLGRFSRFVHRWFRCPAVGVDPRGYLQFVIDRLTAEKYDVLMPVHEQAFLFSRERQTLSSLAGIAVPDFSAFTRVQSKVAFVRLLEELGIPQPSTQIVETEAELLAPRPFPFFIKTDFGTASTGIWRVGRPEDLAAAVRILESRGLLNGDSQLVVQQAASGKLERVQSIFDSGKLIAWHGYEQRQEGPSGGDIAKTSILRPIVRDSVAHIGSSLAWHGALSFDYFFDERQQVAWFIDCNPRLVEPMNAFFSGINLPDILVRLSLTEKTTGLASGREGVRTHMTLMALLDAAARGGRIGLLRRLVRAFLDRDVFRNSREELTPLRLDPATVFPLVITLAFLLANPGSSAAMASYSVRSYSLSREAAKAIIGPLQCGDREERPNTR